MTVALVTGITGFIGSHLARSLVHDGIEVVGLIRAGSSVERLDDIRHQINLQQGDLREPASLQPLFDRNRIEYVFHLAAAGVRASEDQAEKALMTNTVGAFNLGQVAVENQVHKFVNVGSGFEYEPQDIPINEASPVHPINFYGATKAAAYLVLSQLARERQLPLVTVRPFSVYGPAEGSGRLVPHVIMNAINNNPIDLTSGTQLRDYVYVGDVVDAIRACADGDTPPGAVYNVGGGRRTAMTVRAFVELILDRLHSPRAMARFGAIHSQRPEPTCFMADTRKADSELDWQPKITANTGVDLTVAWYRQYYGHLCN